MRDTRALKSRRARWDEYREWAERCRGVSKREAQTPAQLQGTERAAPWAAACGRGCLHTESEPSTLRSPRTFSLPSVPVALAIQRASLGNWMKELWTLCASQTRREGFDEGVKALMASKWARKSTTLKEKHLRLLKLCLRGFLEAAIINFVGQSGPLRKIRIFFCCIHYTSWVHLWKKSTTSYLIIQLLGTEGKFYVAVVARYLFCMNLHESIKSFIWVLQIFKAHDLIWKILSRCPYKWQHSKISLLSSAYQGYSKCNKNNKNPKSCQK